MQKDVRPSSSAKDVCPKCKGAGRVRRDVPYGHPDFGKDFACGCQEQEIREKRRRKMIAQSEQFGFQRDVLLSTFRCQLKGVQEAYQEARGIVERLEAWATQRNASLDTIPPPQEWLIFRGPVGTGKTHLAKGIANACIDVSIETLFVTVPDLLDYLRSAFNPNVEEVYDQLFPRLREVELLILDDLGAEQSTPWANMKLFQLLNHRYNRMLPTIITLNTKAWMFLDERISSRLQDASLVCIVDMEDAQDYRLRQGKNTTRRAQVKGSPARNTMP
jgi:DNA replication protein DnaC